MSSSVRGSGTGKGGLIKVALSLAVRSYETLCSSSESERKTGSSRVPDANISDGVIAEVGIWVRVWLHTFGGSSGLTHGSLSEVPQVPK